MPTYLKTEKGRNGYFFQRAVPKDLQDRLGKVWRVKAADTQNEARREALRLLTMTDQIISVCRAEPTKRLKLLDLIKANKHIGSSFEVMGNDQMDVHDIDVPEFVTTSRTETNEFYHSFNELIEKIVSRNPNISAATVRQWRGECRQFSEAMDIHSFEACTHDLVDEYVCVLVDKVKRQASLNTKWGRLRSLNEYAMSFRWCDELYFDRIKLKGIKINEGPRGELGVEHCATIKDADDYFSRSKLGTKGPFFDRYIRTHWIMRYTIAHVSEVEGLVWDDIDFINNTITFQANELRELKTDQRARRLPMIKPLVAILGHLYNEHPTKTGSIFQLSSETEFGNAIRKQYRRIKSDVSYTPKSCRHFGSGIIQSKHGDIDRRVRYIHGHGKKGATSTSQYGDITTESLLPYLEMLM